MRTLEEIMQGLIEARNDLSTLKNHVAEFGHIDGHIGGWKGVLLIDRVGAKIGLLKKELEEVFTQMKEEISQLGSKENEAFRSDRSDN